ncbi:MAG: NADH-quinone oxidoreductase subunit L [Crenarchaeota archaeon]|nr:NADH-quinone oxidoreductase subunit L [Thermoproteota archaeon]
MFLEMSWLIPGLLFIILPLVVILEYKRTYLGALLSIFAGTVSTILSIGGLIEILSGYKLPPDALKIVWLKYGTFEVSFGILADELSMFMAFIVSFIGTLILIYSLEYMRHDREHSVWAWPRYFFEITLFIAFMLMLVLSSNLLQLLIAWEGVGLCSYLLIGYWWWKPEASKAAKKAFITTRIGDLFLYLATAYAFFVFHTLDVAKLNEISGSMVSPSLGIIALSLFGAAIGKSAQIPLFTWLPWAMEGPTTVSALIHAATMVKAGVFLVARFYPLYMHAPAVFGIEPLVFVAYIGGLTAAFAGVLAVFNNDVKGVLAYSTISHLGLLFLALGVGAYTAALFHLLNHAFFKAGLFLVAGSVLHATHDLRELHKLGGLKDHMKWTLLFAFIGGWAIAGFPISGGFWSKDEILIETAATGDITLFLLGFIAAITGAAYTFRWISLMFYGKPKSKEAEHAHEANLIMLIPIAILVTGAILWGIPILYHGKLAPIGLVLTEQISQALGITIHAAGPAEMLFMPKEVIMIITVGVSFVLALVMFYTYAIKCVDFSKHRRLIKIQSALQQGTIIDVIYDKMAYFFGTRIAKGAATFDTKVVDAIYYKITYLFGIIIAKWATLFDINVIDALFERTPRAMRRLGSFLAKIQTGHINTYMATLTVGMIILICLFLGGLLGFNLVSLLLG